MELLKESDFRKEIKGTPRTGYLFYGDEDYLKAFALKQARELLCPDPTLAFFNDMRLDAVDFTSQKLIDAITPLPMMADRKLISLTGLNFNSMRPEEVDSFCKALTTLEEYDYNTLIVSVAADCINVGRPKKPSAILSRLAEHLTPVCFEAPTNAKLAAWISKHFAHNGVTADPALCYDMIEFCGHSMYILSNEIDKLSFYTLYHNKSEVTKADMIAICTPADEYDAFAFTNAVMNGQQEMALSILSDYKFRRVEPVIIMGQVSSVICDMVAVQAMTAEGASAPEIASVLKIHEYRVGLYQKSLRSLSEKRVHRALQLCVEADASLKLSPSGYTALERLICGL